MFKDRNENYRLKIAFDFDGTLTDPLMFELAQHLIWKGHDVWILTARLGDHHQYVENCEKYGIRPQSESEHNVDIKEVAKKLDISDKIIFIALADKAEIYFREKFDLLFDDDAEWHCNPICKAGGMAVNV